MKEQMMRRRLRSIVRVVTVGALLFLVAEAAEEISNKEKFAKYELIVAAYKCNSASETIAKTYLYLGEGTGSRQSRAQQKKAIEVFNKNFKHLTAAINDKKIKNLLFFNQMNYDDLMVLVNQPYSLDNAQKVMDLVAVVSEGSRHIAGIYKKMIGHNDPVNRVGLSPMIESIAKYYMAYQLGIKDENTVKQMKKAVKFTEEKIKARVSYAHNTVEMNRAISSVDKLWKVVKQFYLDIDEGGLPIIVFKTTKELKLGIKKHNDMYKALKKEKLLGSKK